MDTQNDVIMAISQVSQELAKSKFVVGAKQLKKALKNGTALPTVDNLIVLAALLNVRIDDILVTTVA